MNSLSIVSPLICAALLLQAEAQRAEPSSTSSNEFAPAPAAATSKPTAVRRAPANHVMVKEGKLSDVVKTLEQQMLDSEAGKPWVMPNVIFAPGAEEARIPAPMHLRGVTPAQALALVAAAAGCDLDPLYAPPEEGGPTDEAGNSDFVLEKIIGYRLTPKTASRNDDAQPSAAIAKPDPHAEEFGGVGISLVTENADLVVQDLVDGLPASRSKMVKPGDRLLSVTEGGRAEVDVTGMPIKKATELIRGKPGTELKLKLATAGSEQQTNTVTLTREKLVLPPRIEATPSVSRYGPRTIQTEWPNPFASNVQSNIAFDPSITVDRKSNLSLDKESAPTVRIYALGNILDGPTNEESSKKESHFRELIAESLHKADVDAKTPDLSFHKGSKALIAKATAAQHGIIEQVVSAMRDNEKPASPVGR